jgi:glycosyltransferase involved in cell wall biosynthesis
MIRVAQATAWYPPAHMGGTEVYLLGLIRELREKGILCRVIGPLEPAVADGDEVEGAILRTYEVNANPSFAELHGGAPHDGFSRFKSILVEEKFDVYHQHSWSRGLGAHHLRAARQAGLRTALTVHTPNNICMRGTMMHFGESACDGRVDPFICASCWSHARGAPKSLAYALALVPSSIGFTLVNSLPRSRFSTALCARALAERKRTEFWEMVTNADQIVAVCGWLYEALAQNGVPPEKLTLSRQGVDPAFACAAAGSHRQGSNDGVIRLLYLGRWHPVKGIDVVVRAMRRVEAQLPIELVIHGVGDGPEEQAYATAVRRLADGDNRIKIAAAVPRDRLVETFARANALVVPSLWLETGPLVVLEAKAVRLPVIGSRLGGIAELVQEPHDGILVRSGDVKAWADAITRFARTSALVRTNEKLNDVRTMREAADDMAALYDRMCLSTDNTETLSCESR